MSFGSISNIILFTRGTKGDLYPFLRIGNGFKKINCNVTLLSNYCYEKYANKEGFDFLALDDEESFERLNNLPEFHSNLSLKLKLYKDHIVTNLEKELEIIESKLSESNTVIVAHSNDYLSPLFAAEKFNLPLYLCVLAPSYVHGFSLFEAVLEGLSVEINEIRVKAGLRPVQNWKQWLNKFNRCFAFWPEWFSSGEVNSVISNLECVGFLSIDSVEDRPLKKELINFIEKGTKNILITHGTSRPFDDNYFNLGINACQELGYKLIVSTPFRNLLPEVLPENVIWVDFCPFHHLLPLIDLIIHHGGIGTARESIANAVPQLIIGKGFDRQHNGRIIQKLGLGDWISPSSLVEDVISRKVSAVLSDGTIPLKCKQYTDTLYDEKSLNCFFESVVDQTAFRIQDELNQNNNLEEIEEEIIDSNVVPKVKLTPVKKELLLKLLQKRVKKITSEPSESKLNRRGK